MTRCIPESNMWNNTGCSHSSLPRDPQAPAVSLWANIGISNILVFPFGTWLLSHFCLCWRNVRVQASSSLGVLEVLWCPFVVAFRSRYFLSLLQETFICLQERIFSTFIQIMAWPWVFFNQMTYYFICLFGIVCLIRWCLQLFKIYYLCKAGEL